MERVIPVQHGRIPPPVGTGAPNIQAVKDWVYSPIGHFVHKTTQMVTPELHKDPSLPPRSCNVRLRQWMCHHDVFTCLDQFYDSITYVKEVKAWPSSKATRLAHLYDISPNRGNKESGTPAFVEGQTTWRGGTGSSQSMCQSGGESGRRMWVHRTTG